MPDHTNELLVLNKLCGYQKLSIALGLEHIPTSDSEADEYRAVSANIRKAYKEKNQKAIHEHSASFTTKIKAIYDKYHPKEKAENGEIITTSPLHSQNIQPLSNNFHTSPMQPYFFTQDMGEKFNKHIANQKFQNLIEQFDQDQKYIASHSYLNQTIFQHEQIMLEINSNSQINLWQDDKLIYYVTKLGNLFSGDKKEINSKLLTDFGDVLIIDDTRQTSENTNKKQLGFLPRYILKSRIPKIVDFFDPSFPFLYSFGRNRNVMFRNTFEYTDLLKQKLYSSNSTGNISKSKIINFLKAMTNSDDEYKYILNWLAYFFKNLEKTKIALALIGDGEVSKEIFYSEIIQPIFGTKYCSTIDSKTIKEGSIEKLIDKKVFFHLDNPDESTYKENKKVVIALLTKNELEIEKTKVESFQITLYGQLLITLADFNSLFLKKIKSRCSTIIINPLETILEKLNCKDEPELYADITEDLPNFVSILAQHNINTELLQKPLHVDSTHEENFITIDQKIDEFIDAIKNMRLEYFEPIKTKNEELYKQLSFAFEKESFIKQDLLEYFTIINGHSEFTSNTKFLTKLKEKDEIFTQEIDTLKAIDAEGQEIILFQGLTSYPEVKHKKVSKIHDYTLPKNIDVAKGLIITNREANKRFEYNHENLESAKVFHAEYDTKNKT